MADPARPLTARLDHLQLGSPDPARLAAFYGEVMGMPSEAIGGRWLCRTHDRALLFAPGEAKTLQFAAYRVADPAVLVGLKTRLAAAGVPLMPSPTPLFEPGAVAFKDPDQNLFVFGIPRPPAVSEAERPARLQHLVLGSRDLERSIEFHHTVVGLRVSDRVLDDKGVLRTCFLRTDDEHHSLAVFLTSENRLDHHCYELPDWNAIRDWGDFLAAKRIPVQWGPGRHGPGNNLFLFFHDADGNWLEVSAELEIVAADRPVGVWPHEQRTLNQWGSAPLRS